MGGGERGGGNHPGAVARDVGGQPEQKRLEHDKGQGGRRPQRELGRTKQPGHTPEQKVMGGRLQHDRGSCLEVPQAGECAMGQRKVRERLIAPNRFPSKELKEIQGRDNQDRSKDPKRDSPLHLRRRGRWRACT